MIYLDNASTSFPKAPGVAEAVKRHIENCAGNSSRSSHSGTLDNDRILFETREKLSNLIGATDSSRIVFTSGATMALNTVIRSVMENGGKVLVSQCEHNSVMRPLNFLNRKKNIEIIRFKCDQYCRPSLDDFRCAVSMHPALVIVTAVSNVTGAVFPWHKMSELTRSNRSLFCLDASQAVGTLDLKDAASNVDFILASGHKGLLGPAGTGFLYVREGLEIEPLMLGGTGSKSSEESQPEFMPDKMESGTQNLSGIAGLSAALDFIMKINISEIEKRIKILTGFALDGLHGINELEIKNFNSAHGIVSFIHRKIPVDEIVLAFDRAGIAVRGGLHCAPGAHKCIGTFPEGTVRMSFSYFTNEDEIGAAFEILKRFEREN